MTSSRFWLGLRPSQLPATQWDLQPPSEIVTLFPVSKTTRPLGWSMTHMLTGIVMLRAFSFGTLGIRSVIGKGPNIPLVVQYRPLTCASAGEERVNTKATSAATIPSFLMDRSPLISYVTISFDPGCASIWREDTAPGCGCQEPRAAQHRLGGHACGEE